MDRQELIMLISKMIGEGKSAAEILDEVIAGLTPEDDYECPVCGVCP